MPTTRRYRGSPWWWRSVPIVTKNLGRVWPPRPPGKHGPPAGAFSLYFGRFVGCRSWWTVVNWRNISVWSVEQEWPKLRHFRIVVSNIEVREMSATTLGKQFAMGRAVVNFHWLDTIADAWAKPNVAVLHKDIDLMEDLYYTNLRSKPKNCSIMQLGRYST